MTKRKHNDVKEGITEKE